MKRMRKVRIDLADGSIMVIERPNGQIEVKFRGPFVRHDDMKFEIRFSAQDIRLFGAVLLGMAPPETNDLASLMDQLIYGNDQQQKGAM